MPNKIRVYGKAQNRTALGIVNAYLVMNPNATKEDLEKAFPLSLQDHGSWKSLFKPLEVWQKDVDNQNLWFGKEDEIITLKDGTQCTFLKLWPKDKFENIVNQAKQYDIEIAEFEEGQRSEKGGYRLEYINGYVPTAPVTPKPKKWLWILLAALAVVAVIVVVLLLMRGCQPQEGQEQPAVEEVIPAPALEQIEETEKNFNAVEFEKGKADLSTSAESALRDLAEVMRTHSAIRLRIEGHTSAEGTEAFNQTLSEDRAQAAVDYLVIQEGIDASRLEAVGKGTSEPKNADDPMASENRRIEFIALE